MRFMLFAYPRNLYVRFSFAMLLIGALNRWMHMPITVKRKLSVKWQIEGGG